ncbi:hypothetical protein [Leifsonia sp. NPDC058230]|uniref:hypothetical protein n=1 Tax=Leifsonia sp. NPDC058230 TaxID=3346391 RepID=UPI0036D870A2
MHRIRLAGLAVAATAAAVTLTGCSVITAFVPHVDSAIYADMKEFTPSATSAFGSPTFLPDDATIIRVDYDTQGRGAIMTYASPTHFKAGTCDKPAKIATPDIKDSWWPLEGTATDGFSCPGGWTAVAIGAQVYASIPTSPTR